MTLFSFQTGVRRRKPFGGGHLSITKTPSRRPILGRERNVGTRLRKDGGLRKDGWVLRHQKRPKRGRASFPKTKRVTAVRGRREGGGYSASVELPSVDLPVSKSVRRLTTTHQHGNLMDRALPQLGGFISVTSPHIYFSDEMKYAHS